MRSAYLHIPYCKQACSYCDFYFTISRRTEDAFVQAICTEIQRAYTATEQPQPLESVYLGGGTPSLLNERKLADLLSALADTFGIAQDAEVTLEANPDDITAFDLNEWRQLGINRLSIGVQSFQPEVLRWMNRAHTAEMAQTAVLLAQEAGFDNLSLDLIYHRPGEPADHLAQDLEKLLELGPQHVAAYALTIEPKTALATKVSRGELPAPQDAQFLADFQAVRSTLKAAGFRHYELANFAQPGFEAVHNSRYWTDHPYFGFGPSAHGYDGTIRWENVRNTTHYIERLGRGESVRAFEERLTGYNRFNERIMTRFRTADGLRQADLADPRLLYDADQLATDLNELIDRDLLVAENGSYRLTEQGWPITDGIIRYLVQVPDEAESDPEAEA